MLMEKDLSGSNFSLELLLPPGDLVGDRRSTEERILIYCCLMNSAGSGEAYSLFLMKLTYSAAL